MWCTCARPGDRICSVRIDKYLNEGETVVVSTRTHPKVLFVPILAFVAVLVAAAVVERFASGIGSLIVWVVAGLAIVFLTVAPFVRWWTTTYTFTSRRFMKRTGFIATSGRTIPLNRISGVDFEINISDRIFGCGTLIVTDASEHGQVLIHDIPRVEAAHRVIADELHHRTTPGERRDDGA